MTDLTPLDGLRITTPRLELRVGTEAEVAELGRLAMGGIHPAEEMPFGVAWSDRIGAPGFEQEFAEYHEKVRSSWSRESWHLDLLVWEDGILAGTQALGGKHFATQRVIGTGSWLGAAYQRRGIGTEMRAAILEFAFAGLGAEAATSGWLEGNRASARVSEKLGYRKVGISEVSPRDVPVAHHDMRLERSAWRSPVMVETSGLGPALPLFGADQPSERSAADSD